jgi:hypothetical protein
MMPFCAEVHIRSKLETPLTVQEQTDFFRQGVESGRDFHQDASDVKRTVGERAEGARLVLTLISPRRSAGDDADLNHVA